MIADETSSRWPNAPVPDATLIEKIREKLARNPDPEAAHVADLYLAWWAGTGDSAGIGAFEGTYGGELRRLAARFPDVPSEELLQQLRVKLFVGDAPRIRDYGGSGSLLSWLRVVAVRAFVDIVRSVNAKRYEELDENELLGLPAEGQARLSDEVRTQVKKAFASAVAQLAPRQRVFLRHAYVDRLTLDQIAASYSIHRATVARTLASAREQLIEHTRAGVQDALGITPQELASAMATLDSRLDLSLSRILKT